MKILMPLPHDDFDPTESAVPWKVLTEAGHEMVFATPEGEAAKADFRMLTGQGLGPWSPILRARADARDHYAAMSEDRRFRQPMTFEEARQSDYDAIILPGGHAPRMRPYLESKLLQSMVADQMIEDKPLGAICHGVIVVARATQDGVSVLRGRKTTALPASMEMSAWAMTFLWLGRYYRTYKATVQAEVTEALGEEGTFYPGPRSLLRDGPEHLSRGFTVRDSNYLSARWPGDCYRFAHEFAEILASIKTV